MFKISLFLVWIAQSRLEQSSGGLWSNHPLKAEAELRWGYWAFIVTWLPSEEQTSPYTLVRTALYTSLDVQIPLMKFKFVKRKSLHPCHAQIITALKLGFGLVPPSRWDILSDLILRKALVEQKPKH